MEMISSVSPSWAMYQGFAKEGISKSTVPVGGPVAYRSHFQDVKVSFPGSFGASIWRLKVGFNDPFKKMTLLPSIKCENSDKGERSFEHVSVERPPYHSYLDSTSGELEPTLGDRASIPGQEYWPEGTASRVRAARAPEPTGVSSGSSSHGQMPGSRRKKYKKTSVSSSENMETNSVSDGPVEVDPTHNVHEDLQEPSSETIHNVHEEPQEPSSEYVVYQTEPQEENVSEYEKDKQVGRPHPFIDPKAKKPIEEPLSSEELWWNWKKPEKEQWSRWQRRRPDVETVFLKAMAETGQVKLYGEHPTLTETSLYRARRHIYKEER